MKAVMICEEYVEGLTPGFRSEAELKAYMAGFTDGANKYGAGGAYCVTMKDIESGECPEELAEEVRELLGAKYES